MKLFTTWLAILLVSVSGFSQAISYHFAAPNAAHHEAEISVTADKLPQGPVYFRMSRSSPGRYAKHEFGKNVYNVKAFDEKGKALTVEKADADVYRITAHTGKVKVTYTLYGNYADGTYASIDRSGFHLNIPATFMWVKGMEKAPITLHFDLPQNTWKIATQLKQGSDATTFTAPDLQYFMDSPVKVGDLRFREWSLTNPDGKKYNFRIAFDVESSDDILDAFAKKVERMVREAQAVFGEVPAYDHGTYTFLATINPYAKGDGMEHRNSTMITSARKFDGNNSFLGVFSHEFFHCWNVERIRPADLEPFDFEKSNMSGGLWLAEGFTQYYGDLILKRAGLMDEAEFVDEMSGLVNTKMNGPGAQKYSPIENSQRAVFVDAGVSIDRNNYSNMFSSYYTYGGALALALDLDLRSRFKNTSLDNYMRELWKRFGKTAKAYKISDLQAALTAITNADYATSFFNKYVYGHQQFDYAAAFKNANFAIEAREAGKAWMGRPFFAQNSSALQLAGNTIVNTPLYNTGADVDDILLSLDGKKLTSRNDLADVIANHKPGDTVPFSYSHRGNVVDTILTFAEDPWIKISATSSAATSRQQDFKKAWLDKKSLLP